MKPDNPDNTRTSGQCPTTFQPGQTGHHPIGVSGCPDVRESRGELLSTDAGATEKNSLRPVPASDCPVLIGIDSIAGWLAISRGRCRGLIDDGVLPTFRLPGRSVRAALKTEIAAAMLEHAKQPGARTKSPARVPKRSK
jgi:hypothetical protein